MCHAAYSNNEQCRATSYCMVNRGPASPQGNESNQTWDLWGFEHINQGSTATICSATNPSATRMFHRLSHKLSLKPSVIAWATFLGAPRDPVVSLGCALRRSRQWLLNGGYGNIPSAATIQPATWGALRHPRTCPLPPPTPRPLLRRCSRPAAVGGRGRMTGGGITCEALGTPEPPSPACPPQTPSRGDGALLYPNLGSLQWCPTNRERNKPKPIGLIDLCIDLLTLL